MSDVSSCHDGHGHTLCPHCGIAPADADGFACDYCRGFAHRPSRYVAPMTVTEDGHGHDIQYGPPPLRPGMRWETRAERARRYADLDAASQPACRMCGATTRYCECECAD